MKSRTSTHNKTSDDSLSVFDSFYNENKGRTKTRGRPKKEATVKSEEIRLVIEGDGTVVGADGDVVLGAADVGVIVARVEEGETVEVKSEMVERVEEEAQQVLQAEESKVVVPDVSDEILGVQDVMDMATAVKVNGGEQRMASPPRVAVKSKPKPEEHAITPSRKRYFCRNISTLHD